MCALLEILRHLSRKGGPQALRIRTQCSRKWHPLQIDRTSLRFSAGGLKQFHNTCSAHAYLPCNHVKTILMQLRYALQPFGSTLFLVFPGSHVRGFWGEGKKDNRKCLRSVVLRGGGDSLIPLSYVITGRSLASNKAKKMLSYIASSQLDQQTILCGAKRSVGVDAIRLEGNRQGWTVTDLFYLTHTKLSWITRSPFLTIIGHSCTVSMLSEVPQICFWKVPEEAPENLDHFPIGFFFKPYNLSVKFILLKRSFSQQNDSLAYF